MLFFEEHSSSCVVYFPFSGTLFPVSMIDGDQSRCSEGECNGFGFCSLGRLSQFYVAISIYRQERGAQWQVIELRSRGCGFEPHWKHCGVSLCKTVYPLLSAGSTQENPSRHD